MHLATLEVTMLQKILKFSSHTLMDCIHKNDLNNAHHAPEVLRLLHALLHKMHTSNSTYTTRGAAVKQQVERTILK